MIKTSLTAESIRKTFDELYDLLCSNYSLVERRATREMSATYILPLDSHNKENPVTLTVSFEGINLTFEALGNGISLASTLYYKIESTEELFRKIDPVLNLVWKL